MQLFLGFRIVSIVASLLFSFISLGQQNSAVVGIRYVADIGPESPLTNGIPNLQKTTDVIYRGGRPNPAGMAFLKKSGFKTIINLENDNRVVAAELEMAKKLGMQMYSSPMSWQVAPSDAQVDLILNALKNPQMYPIFIHCHHGMDRTGLIVGLFRVLVQKWSAKDAYAEMLKYGFHPELKALDNYFRLRTK